jgi:hypothetical protein
VALAEEGLMTLILDRKDIDAAAEAIAIAMRNGREVNGHRVRVGTGSVQGDFEAARRAVVIAVQAISGATCVLPNDVTLLSGFGGACWPPPKRTEAT